MSTFVDGTRTAAAGGSRPAPVLGDVVRHLLRRHRSVVAGADGPALQANRDAAWTPRQAYEALLAAAPALPEFRARRRACCPVRRPAGFRFHDDCGARPGADLST